MFQNIDWVVPRGATTQTLGSKAMEGTNMTAEEKKKVAVDFLRLAGQGHPREMEGAAEARVLQAALLPRDLEQDARVQRRGLRARSCFVGLASSRAT